MRTATWMPDLPEPGAAERATGNPEIVPMDEEVVFQATCAVAESEPTDPGLVERATGAIELISRVVTVGAIGLGRGVVRFAHG
jgi:hypothetical protein